MEWLAQNWIWLLFIGAMVAMHLFGHGGHGAHGGQGKAPRGHGGCGGGHAADDGPKSKERPRPKAGHEGHST